MYGTGTSSPYLAFPGAGIFPIELLISNGNGTSQMVYGDRVSTTISLDSIYDITNNQSILISPVPTIFYLQTIYYVLTFNLNTSLLTSGRKLQFNIQTSANGLITYETEFATCASPPTCGDGFCNEDNTTCFVDCGIIVASSTGVSSVAATSSSTNTCGDGNCNEDPLSCPADCNCGPLPAILFDISDPKCVNGVWQITGDLTLPKNETVDLGDTQLG